MFRLINFGLHAVTISLLLWALRTLRSLVRAAVVITNTQQLIVLQLVTIGRKEETIMDQGEQLLQKIAEVDAAVSFEEQHIDLLIEALKQPHDSPATAQAIEKLEAIRLTISGFHAGEEPAQGKDDTTQT